MRIFIHCSRWWCPTLALKKFQNTTSEVHQGPVKRTRILRAKATRDQWDDSQRAGTEARRQMPDFWSGILSASCTDGKFQLSVVQSHAEKYACRYSLTYITHIIFNHTRTRLYTVTSFFYTGMTIHFDWEMQPKWEFMWWLNSGPFYMSKGLLKNFIFH